MALILEVRPTGRRRWAVYGGGVGVDLMRLDGDFTTRADAERRRDYLELDDLLPRWRQQARKARTV